MSPSHSTVNLRFAPPGRGENGLAAPRGRRGGLLCCLFWGLLLLGFAGKLGAAESDVLVWTANASAIHPGVCAGTTIAVARIPPYNSWTNDWEVPPGERIEWTHRYRTADGKQFACRRVRVSCIPYGKSELYTRTNVSLCYSELPNPRREEKTGPPRLKIIAPRFVSSLYRQVGGVWVGDGKVHLTVRIIGELTEKWWCPEVEVEWPDETRSRKAADCDPWTGSEEQRSADQSFEFAHPLGPGVNEVLVRLRRVGKVIHMERLEIQVLG